MKTAVKLWLSGMDAEREDHYSSTRNVLFYKGRPLALRYWSKLTERYHIIKVTGHHVPCNRKMNELPSIDSLVPMVQNEKRSELNNVLWTSKFTPIYLNSKIIDDETLGCRNDVLDIHLSRYNSGYIFVTARELNPDFGLNVSRLGMYTTYNYNTGDHDYHYIYRTKYLSEMTMAKVWGHIIWNADMEQLTRNVLSQVIRGE